MTASIPPLADGLSFADDHVLVTGAATGLGRHIALSFAAAGATVSALDIAETPRDEQQSVVTEIEELGGSAAFLQADLTDETQVRESIAAAIDRFGPLSVLVNNAGVNHLGSVDEVSVADWDTVLAVNLRGAFLTARYALPSLLETSGSIVNIASTAGLHGSPGYAAYGPSKAGLVNLTRQLAVDFSPDGVRVNAIAPGIIDAGMAAQELDDPETVAYKQEKTLLPRFGTPEDVSNAVVFLASDAASFVTGETLVVDGGWCA
ncbi:SDR family NAD(P)-dependent oxidoreductase [Haladaptatus sp. DJG-WS-42]|uniref:SDR family NAD(P)-dependent oxidoreductase n=1 Tax=Haladaptatus sp. DJG-WS-42 TaxID=3120516 RepID=UPI0030D1C4B8